MPEPRPRLPGLEALRGFAALAVALHHIGVESFRPALPLMPAAYLAVDLFFVLSGFVIGLAYDAALAQGLSPARFLGRRLLRLYPLYLLSLVLGLAAAGLGWLAGAPIGGPLLLAGLPAALLLLPLPLPATGHAWRPVVPLNPAAWSLSVEIWGNFAYALLRPWLSRRLLLLGLGLAALALVGLRLGHYGGLNFGAGQYGFALGWLRFGFGFAAGLLLCRLWLAWRPPALGGWPLAGLALALLLSWSLPGSWAWRDLPTVLLLGPAAILCGAGLRLRGAAARRALWLGGLSYPIYILHWPLLYLAGIGMAVAGIEPARTPLLSTLGLLGLILLAAALAERWVDRPLRAWLAARPAPAPSGLPQQAR